MTVQQRNTVVRRRTARARWDWMDGTVVQVSLVEGLHCPHALLVCLLAWPPQASRLDVQR